MSGFLTGVMQGFQGRRETEIERNLEQDRLNRAAEGRIFEHLLSSDDPEMRALAMTGMFESASGRKKPGFAGYLGEMQKSQMYPAVLARMQEMVPTGGVGGMGGGPSPPTPGGAAMSQNQPVRTGSTPLQIPTGPTGIAEPVPGSAEELGGGGGMVGAPPPAPSDRGMPAAGPGTPPVGAPPPIYGAQGIGMLPAPESAYRRRGTGVPTAEEIAERQARIPLETRINVARQQLMQAGATPEEIQQAVMGMLGAPQRQKGPSAMTQWGVKLPGSDVVQPVIFDPDTRSFVLSGGQPLPPGAQMVRMGGGGAGRPLRNVIADPSSRTGRTAVYLDPATGEELYREEDIAWTPPPATSGAITTLDENGVPVVSDRSRAGGLGGTLGDANVVEPPQGQADAKAILATVDKAISDSTKGGLGSLRGVPPGERDRQTAQISNNQFKTYKDLQRAANAAKVPARAARTGRPVDRVKARLQQMQAAEGGPPAVSTTVPATPPTINKAR
jgi:hypothetical protein